MWLLSLASAPSLPTIAYWYSSAFLAFASAVVPGVQGIFGTCVSRHICRVNPPIASVQFVQIWWGRRRNFPAPLGSQRDQLPLSKGNRLIRRCREICILRTFYSQSALKVFFLSLLAAINFSSCCCCECQMLIINRCNTWWAKQACCIKSIELRNCSSCNFSASRLAHRACPNARVFCQRFEQ